MKMIFCFLMIITGIMVLADPPHEIIPDRQLFNQGKYHIQGMCCTEDAIYLTQLDRLWKFGWDGKLLKTVPAESHIGDICFWEGKLYTSVGVSQGPDKGKGKIRVFDTELNPVREAILPKACDGITVCDGVLYLGIAKPAEFLTKETRRKNLFQRFDPRTLQPLGPVQVVDSGYGTRCGIQAMASDGKVILLAFYPAVKGEPTTFIADKDLKILSEFPASEFSAANGLDFIPEKISGSKEPWLLCVREWKFQLESRKYVNGRPPHK